MRWCSRGGQRRSGCFWTGSCVRFCAPVRRGAAEAMVARIRALIYAGQGWGSAMKILQVTGPGSHRVLDVATPEPGPGEVLLHVTAVTTCPQWDLHLRHNEPMFVGHRFRYPYTPGQPGHEATGEVAALGPGVTELSVGDRVSTWRDGGHQRPGCYAQYVVRRPQEDLIRVPAGLPPEATAPVELAMCVGASFLMLRQMDAVRGRRFAVAGLGPAGLVAAQMARAEGAARLCGFDLSPQRCRRAMDLGLVDEAHDPRETPGSMFPVRGTGGSLALDSAVDCAGGRAAVEFLMDRTADVVTLFAVQREDYVFRPVHRSLRLCGYPGHSRAAAEYAVDLIAHDRLDLRPLVTHHLPLERYEEGVDFLESQQALKVCFWPWADARG